MSVLEHSRPSTDFLRKIRGIALLLSMVVESSFDGILHMQAGMAQQQRRFHWDKRKRQYVQLQPNERVFAGKRIKTESGGHTKGQAKSSGLYKKWSKAHHTKIMPVGVPEDDHAPHVQGLNNR